MTHRCDWPGCEAQTEHWIQDGWSSCEGEDISFLPDDALLCPKHADAFEEIACRRPVAV